LSRIYYVFLSPYKPLSNRHLAETDLERSRRRILCPVAFKANRKKLYPRHHTFLTPSLHISTSKLGWLGSTPAPEGLHENQPITCPYTRRLANQISHHILRLRMKYHSPTTDISISRLPQQVMIWSSHRHSGGAQQVIRHPFSLPTPSQAVAVLSTYLYPNYFFVFRQLSRQLQCQVWRCWG